jgi:hypothetical protein
MYCIISYVYDIIYIVMKNILPSKKFIYILLSIFIALGIIFLFSWIKDLRKTSAQNKIVADAVTINTAQKELIALDTDNDGLKDWEEALWKTDPNKSDTDSDGTDDYTEIQTYRDPREVNTANKNEKPSDMVSEEIILADKKIAQEYSQLTTTEKVGRDLFSQYIARRNVNSSLSKTDEILIIDEALSNLPTITFKKYEEKDIIVTNLSDNETFKQYSNDIGEIILNGMRVETEKLETIILDFSNIEADDGSTEIITEIFQRLNPLIEKNNTTINSLLKIKVPKKLLNEHLNLLNSFQEIYESLKLIRDSAEDIIMLIPLLNNYNLTVNNLNNSFTAIITSIKNLKIVYNSELDYGYQFFNVIIK